MSARVLLVTGSRALDDTAAARRWTRAMILRAAADCIEHSDRLRIVVGDAAGADGEAEDLAHGLNAAMPGVECSAFRLDGVISHSDRENERWTDAEPPAVGTPERRRWPLARNVAMVERVARHGGRVVVLALKAPWSRTDGTGHTASAAERAGLTVRRETCPASLGPKRACALPSPASATAAAAGRGR